MATIKWYTFSCPHCQKKLSTSLGDAYYGNMPDAFACPHCGQVVTLSPEQRLSKMAEQQSSKGALLVFGGCLLFSIAVVYYWFKQKQSAPLHSGQWLVAIGVVLVGTLFLFGLIQSVRKALAHDRLKARSKVK